MKTFIIPVLFCLFYLCLIIPAVNSHLTYDELFWPISAQSLLKIGKPLFLFGESADWSPSLYLNLQAFFYKVLGIANYSARLIGVGCAVLQLFLFLLVGKILFKNSREQKIFLFIASVLFTTNPGVIQGSLLPYDDTTLLPLFFLIFSLIFIRFEEKRERISIIGLGIIFSLALWSKLTTPFFFIICMLIYYMLKRDFRGLLDTFWVYIIGAGIFLFTWKWYCITTGTEFWGPIKYCIFALLTKNSFNVYEFSILKFSLVILRFTLWFGFYFILLWFFVFFKRLNDFRIRRFIEPIDFLIFFAILVGIGYFFVGGVTFGFPKYHYPILTAMSIASAFILKDFLIGSTKKDFWIYSIISVLSALYYYFAVGDLLYIINFSLRNTQVFSPKAVKVTLLYFGYKFILYLLPLIIVSFIIGVYKKTERLSGKIAVILVVLIISTNLSLDAIQCNAGYLVRYCYGDRGTQELINYLNENTKSGDRILATPDIIYYLKDKNIPYLPMHIGHALDSTIKIIKQPSVKFVVYSIGHNDIKQFREVFANLGFISEVKANFIVSQIGSYTIYKRK